MTFYRIDEYRTYLRGKRGSAVTVPNTVLKDMGVKPRGKLSVYRGVIDGLNVTVMANADLPGLTNEEPTNPQGKRSA
jgi:hypothetical protein